MVDYTVISEEHMDSEGIYIAGENYPDLLAGLDERLFAEQGRSGSGNGQAIAPPETGERQLLGRMLLVTNIPHVRALVHNEQDDGHHGERYGGLRRLSRACSTGHFPYELTVAGSRHQAASAYDISCIEQRPYKVATIMLSGDSEDRRTNLELLYTASDLKRASRGTMGVTVIGTQECLKKYDLLLDYARSTGAIDHWWQMDLLLLRLEGDPPPQETVDVAVEKARQNLAKTA